MKKLEKDLYIKHAKRLAAIINEKSTFVAYLTRKDFNSVLKNELNVLFACEKLFPKVELEGKITAKALVRELNKLTKDTFKLDEKFKYEDETDLIDAINYLTTFCNNMFKVNLDDLVGGKNVTATDPKIDLRAKPTFDEQGPRMNSNFAFAGAGIPLAATPYENPYLVGKAYAKIQDDMVQGKFYRYKTKPRIIPIVKWISTILLMLLALSLLVAGVFAFMAYNLKVSDGSETGSIPGVIGSGVFYLVMAGFCVYPIVIAMKSLVGKGGKNDNLKYYFNWPFVVITLVLALLFVLLDLNRTWLMPFSIVDDSGIGGVGFYGWKIMFIVVCAAIGLNIVPLIIGSINNPKPDPEAVEKKVREYIDLFTAESGQMPVPPKADVQKPTKVEKPKKDKDKTKDQPKK